MNNHEMLVGRDEMFRENGHTKTDKLQRSALYRNRLSAHHTLKIVLRNGLYAALGRIIIGIIKLITKRGLGKAFRSRILGEFFSLNPLKWAAVFGGFSSFRLCVQIVSRYGKYVGLPHKGAALLSGCLCALPALVMNKTTRIELCLYALVRALHSFGRGLLFPLLPERLQKFQHYDVLLMCLSSSQIAYGCLFAQSTLPSAYTAFLVKASTYDKRFIRSHSGYIRGYVTPDMVDLCLDKHYPLVMTRGVEAEKVLCDIAHRGYSCNSWGMVFLLRNMLKMGIPFYGPLKLVTTLLMQRKKLLLSPGRTLLRILRSTLTSSLFLALYTTCIVRSSCFALRHGSRSSTVTTLLCSLAGLATFLEPKSRRMDLALYCAMYAIRSFIMTQYRLGHIPYPRHWVIFSAYVMSVGFMFYEYEEEPQLLNPRARSVLRLLLGEKPPKRSSRMGSKVPSKVASLNTSPAMRPAVDPPEKALPPMDLGVRPSC